MTEPDKYPTEHELLRSPQTVSAAIPTHELLNADSFWKKLNPADWLFAVALAAVAALVQIKMPHHMDMYETAILWASTLTAVSMGWFFKPLRWFLLGSILLGYLAVGLYDGEIDHASDKFLLRYFLSSQSAIMWQCALTVLAFTAYAGGMLSVWLRQQRQPENTAQQQGSLLFGIAGGSAWAAAFAGFVGLLVRWHESYLLRPDAGHIPVSNLYEVFILFMVITGLMYLYYERKFNIQRLGAFVYLLLCGLVAFVLWYSAARGAHEIRPLIEPLQSWWMKLHVPANFIGYGGFCMAAMFGSAELLALHNPRIRHLLPDPALIEEAMYKAIAVGFLFFTIATILGALWAHDAWGGYWSWDPKEVWALIVWLNYAVWLHLRLVKGWRGKIPAWWAVIGLFITAFAFVGVNMFLSGMHSYGGL